MQLRLSLVLALLGLAGLLGAVASALADGPDLPYHAIVPSLSRGELPTPTPRPTPTPEPPPYGGPVASLYLGSAGITSDAVVEPRSTEFKAGIEYFEEPTQPSRIAWYPAFGHPGFRGANSIFSAHVDYIGYGVGPFYNLRRAQPGDALYVTMDNGLVYTYTVRSVEVVPTDQLDMNAVVFVPLDSYTERVTLISCSGTFIPDPSGYGGTYDSRLILVAERYIP